MPVQDQELNSGITKILRALEIERDLPAGYIGLEILVNTQMSWFSVIRRVIFSQEQAKSEIKATSSLPSVRGRLD